MVTTWVTITAISISSLIASWRPESYRTRDELWPPSSNPLSLTAAYGQATTEPSAPQESRRGASIAIESDALAHALPGYSGIVNLSLRNGFLIAFGTGRYDVPSFLLEGEYLSVVVSRNCVRAVTLLPVFVDRSAHNRGILHQPQCPLSCCSTSSKTIRRIGSLSANPLSRELVAEHCLTTL